MKKLITPTYVFNTANRTVDLSAMTDFDITKLYEIVNITRNELIYSHYPKDNTLETGVLKRGFTSVSGSVITLEMDTSLMNDSDNLVFLYEEDTTSVPNDTTVGNSTLVSSVPQNLTRMCFQKAISNNVDTDYLELIRTGTGMTVGQTAGTLSLASGTTARSETIIRSKKSWNGSIRLYIKNILSQRIVNNNFIVELVDIVGDSLAYVINSATSITVKIPNNTFTLENVGQSISIGNFNGTGTFLSGRYVIASISGNDVTFTVSGFAAGTGTCSLFGRSFYRLLYDSTTVTQAKFDTARCGYGSGDTTITTLTSASPGHMIVLTGSDVNATIADQLVASSGLVSRTVRGSRVEKVPGGGVDLKLQIRVLNGTTAPATTTVWTIGEVVIANYSSQDVAIQNVQPQSVASGLPVEIIKTIAAPTQPVSGTVTANSGTNGMAAYADSVTNLAGAATFTGTSRDGGATQAYARFVAKAFSDVAGTLRIEQSADNTNWRRATADTAVGAGSVVQLEIFATARYHRVIYVNGAGAQSQFILNSAYLRV